MQKVFLPALLIALASGLAIGVQSTLIGSAGKTAGAVLTGLLVNFLAGAAAGVVLILIYAREGRAPFMGIQLQTFWMVLGAGLLGIGIISGIAFALPKVGIAAGLSAIIAGQMAMAVFVDTFALAGGDPIPLNFSRLGGLLFLALGTWAILPKE